MTRNIDNGSNFAPQQSLTLDFRIGSCASGLSMRQECPLFLQSLPKWWAADSDEKDRVILQCRETQRAFRAGPHEGRHRLAD